MKAARLYGIKDMRIENISIEEPKEDEVQIKLAYMGICGSDLHSYHHGFGIATVPHPITGLTAPMVLGHEGAGEIVKVGKNVSNVKVGDRVCIEPLVYCGKCEACKKGHYNVCEHGTGPDGSGNVIGDARNGVFAEFVNVDAVNVYKIPDNMDMMMGALVEPVAVSVQTIQKSGLKVGQSVLIMGAGPIGLIVATTAMLAGATNVFIADVAEERLELARKIGVPYVINSGKTNVVETINKINGKGVDIAYDVAGVQATFDVCTDAVKKNGKIMVVAVFNEPPRVDFSKLLMSGIDISTTCCYSNVYPETIRLVAGNQELYRNVITKVISLDRIVEDGLEYLAGNKTEAKILVTPNK